MRELICIACPVGCALTVGEVDGEVVVRGNGCERGQVYGKQEFSDPRRTVTTVVLVSGGDRETVSVKTLHPVKKELIPYVLAEIKKLRLEAPIVEGQVLIGDIAETKVVATISVGRIQ